MQYELWKALDIFFPPKFSINFRHRKIDVQLQHDDEPILIGKNDN